MDNYASKCLVAPDAMFVYIYTYEHVCSTQINSLLNQSSENANIKPGTMMMVVYSVNHEATMSCKRKVRELLLSSWGTFLLLKVRIKMCGIYHDTPSPL